MKKKVLILTADAGFGHRSAANAIASALSKETKFEIETRIENLLDSPKTPAPLRNTQTGYDKIVTESPKFYEFSYESSDKRLPTNVAKIGLSAMLYGPFSKTMKEFNPDVLVNTYPLYQGPAQTWYLLNEDTKKAISKSKKTDDDSKSSSRHKHIPMITIITDLVSVHLIWMSTLPDIYCVATHEMKEQIAGFGVDRERILCTGIPVNPVFAEEKRSKRELREHLGWNPEKTTIIAIGSKRVSNMMDYLDLINHSGFNIQLIMVAGGDETLYQEMQNTTWHVPAKIYNFTKELPVMMLASDIVVTKAGGLVTSESLAASLPMILIDVLPGQEEGNALYIQENNAGVHAKKPIDILHTLTHWFENDGYGLRKFTENARKIGKPRSSLDIADLIVEKLSES